MPNPSLDHFSEASVHDSIQERKNKAVGHFRILRILVFENPVLKELRMR
jgi:hypothetical protein